MAHDPETLSICQGSSGCGAKATWECLHCGERFCEDCVAAPQVGREHANRRCMEPEPPKRVTGLSVAGVLWVLALTATWAAGWLR